MISTAETAHQAPARAAPAADARHEPTYTVAVRDLCEFAAKAGHLDHRFTPSPSAQDGIAGHQVITARRGSARRSELSVSTVVGALRVRGRIDGFDADAGLLDEVKTYRGEFDRIPSNHRALHWAQAKVYGALLCRQLALAELKLALVYFEVVRQEETVLTETHAALDLECFFVELCESFVAWAQQEAAHRSARDAALHAMAFAFPAFRTGQRTLAQNVFEAARRGCDLLAQAPTGIGKTAAVLYPMLKACATEGLDKVFYLTAKGTGQPMVLEAIGQLRARNPDLPLRVLELVARASSCEHPGSACHPDSCPLAVGFYDRLPAARAEAVGVKQVDRESIRRIARAHSICPYYLTQELVRWSDVVVGDYSYFYDSTALLHLMTTASQWKVGVLVDEAHNLVERARTMYSAELLPHQLKVARRRSPAHLHAALDRLDAALTALEATTAKAHSPSDSAARQGPIDLQSADYAVIDVIPVSLLIALQEATAALGEYAIDSSHGIDPVLLECYFGLLRFQRRLQSFANHSIFDVSAADDPIRRTLTIRNVVPASFLKARHACGHVTVMFSATLMPMRFYADLLGLDDSAGWLEVESPFRAEQLDVAFITGIATRWQRRAASLLPIADVMASQYAKRPGNYLAFFSSFDYLERAAETLGQRHPHIAQWSQARRGDRASRTAFLERFQREGNGIGFAVLGGAFSEGIDLPGNRLIGAFIATLGLPQLNAVNEAMRHRLDELFGSGHDYAYLFPGMRKVVQAAGRVIRSTSDHGSVHLIDPRFQQAAVRQLLPRWWNVDQERGREKTP